MPARLLRLVAPLLALVVLLSACGTVEDEAAATVNGTDITADSIRDELKLHRANKAYQEAQAESLAQDGLEPTPVAGSGKGTFSRAYAAELVRFRVIYQLIEDALREDGVTVDADTLDAAREAASGVGGFDKFPKSYREELVRQRALIELAATQGAEDVTTDCTSHILILSEGHTPEEAKALIDQAAARLDAGEDFATVAREVSQDGSAAEGGEIGCQAAGTLVPEYEQAASELEVGEVSEPVQTQFGWHIIRLDDREASSGPSQAGLNAYLGEALCGDDVDVHIDPQWGTWDRSACDEGGLPTVTAPKGS